MRNQNHPRKGARIAVEPIRKLKDIKAISKYLNDSPRDQLLFVMGINNGLRACDLVQLKVGQVRGLKAGGSVTIKESKTGKENILAAVQMREAGVKRAPESIRRSVRTGQFVERVIAPPTAVGRDLA